MSVRKKKQLLLVSSLSFSYGTTSVLDNVSFEIEKGDFVALIGPNGCGKTTLVKLLLGFLSPSKGRITQDINTDEIGYVPQRYVIDKNFPGTVRELLGTGDDDAIELTGIVTLLDKKFVSLSGGQQQKVLITLALQRNPRLLILDEPMAGVDLNAQQLFYDLLLDLNKKGITILLVTHEVGVLSSLVNKVFCINHKLCCVTKPEELPVLLKQMYGSHFVHYHHKRGGQNND